jgi:hypothetical protein
VSIVVPQKLSGHEREDQGIDAELHGEGERVETEDPETNCLPPPAANDADRQRVGDPGALMLDPIGRGSARSRS